MRLLRYLTLFISLFLATPSYSQEAPIDTPEQSNQVSLDKNTITPEQLDLAVAFFEQEAFTQKSKAKCLPEVSIWIFPFYFCLSRILFCTLNSLHGSPETASISNIIAFGSIAIYSLEMMSKDPWACKNLTKIATQLINASYRAKKAANYNSQNHGLKNFDTIITSEVISYLEEKLSHLSKSLKENPVISFLPLVSLLSGAINLICKYKATPEMSPESYLDIASTAALIALSARSCHFQFIEKADTEKLERLSWELLRIKDLVTQNKVNHAVLFELAEEFGERNLERVLLILES
jgi:hypothetical protein